MKPSGWDLAIRTIVEEAVALNREAQKEAYSAPLTMKDLGMRHEVHIRLGARCGLTQQAATVLRRLYAGKRVLWLTGHRAAARVATAFPEAEIMHPLEALREEVPMGGPFYHLVVVDSGFGFRALLPQLRVLALRLADNHEGEFTFLVLG